MSVYGTLLYHLDDDHIDRVGLRTLIYGRAWQASRSIMTPDELDAEEPLPPAVGAAMMLIGAQRTRSHGGLRTQWTFQGVRGDGKSVTFKDRNTSFDFHFQPGFSEVSVLVHPLFRRLQELFDGFVDQDGNVFWPITIKSKTGSGGFGGGTGKERPNPMLGQETWRVMDGSYSFRYLSFEPISLAHQGRVFQTAALPGRPPRVGDKRNWLGAPVDSRCLGVVFDNVEHYLLSPEGGWPPQYTIRDGGKESGLTTGVLDTGGLATE